MIEAPYLIRQRQQLITDRFHNCKSDSQSGWTLRIHRDGEVLVLGMYWTDCATPTHILNVPREEFLKALKGLEQ